MVKEDTSVLDYLLMITLGRYAGLIAIMAAERAGNTSNTDDSPYDSGTNTRPYETSYKKEQYARRIHSGRAYNEKGPRQ